MTSPNFMVIGLQIRKLNGGGGRVESLTVLDSKKPGLFRVKVTLFSALVMLTMFTCIVSNPLFMICGHISMLYLEV